MPHFDLESFIRSAGYIGIVAMIFAETGLLVGVILPGDSLLFTAGFLASQDYFNIWLLVPLCFVAAVVGDAVGYQIGLRYGRQYILKRDSRFFKPEYLTKSEAFFEKHGGKTIILARFMPIVRTCAPMIAGMSAMRYRKFFAYNVVGAFLWAVGVTVGGYFLGSTIPGVDKYLLPIIAVIVILSLMPTAIHLWREQRHDILASARTYVGRRSSPSE